VKLMTPEIHSGVCRERDDFDQQLIGGAMIDPISQTQLKQAIEDCIGVDQGVFRTGIPPPPGFPPRRGNPAENPLKLINDKHRRRWEK